MKSLSKILMVITVLLSYTMGFAQIRNAKTERVKIYGNCDMCKANIEKAGNVKNISSVEWNKDTKMATLSYDAQKTNGEEVLKRIALAGYDNEKFLAPDDVYNTLAGCCQYTRELKPASTDKDQGMNMNNEHGNHDHSKMTQSTSAENKNVSQFSKVFDTYFSLKDALVNTDAGASSANAASLVKAIQNVEMGKLSNEEHTVWMKVLKEITAQAEKIAGTKDISKQRETFALLSENIYALTKVSKQDETVYYQHCPMFNNGKGANWLSKEEAIKNPFYGSKMLTCGSVQETIINK
ncbi:DUF3347 domain-containing protein [Chryseobacterium culicis]|uniref:Mercury transporter n=1 Tax=Chryseobacterium culicis TaxID=680127 RepID=A0A2S9CRX0_CHRCI|nr:DUF3347 domain-containing protein [Chryseobacterium culicis]PRB83273.1 mercury transporter [Chryseobacterium culicis]PRB89515.1 mercury transporter [Chryseobacterium culicis]